MARSDRPHRSCHPAIERDVYLVLDDFGGRIGQAWARGRRRRYRSETVITELLEGQYIVPFRVIGFNTAEGWSRDVSADVAQMPANAVRRSTRSAVLPGEFVNRYLEMTTVAKP